jgi:hypothetical protein
MSHVIFSRSASNNELSADRIATLAPAVFATTRKETLSPRYGQLHTDSLLPVMRDHGFVPVQAAQKRSRKASPEHSQHMIAFSQVDGLMGDGGIRPEIIFTTATTVVVQLNYLQALSALSVQRYCRRRWVPKPPVPQH